MRSKITAIGFMMIVMALCQATVATGQTREVRGGWTRTRPTVQNPVKQPEPGPAKDEDARADSQDIKPAAAAKPSLVGTWLITIKNPDFAPPFDSFNALWCLTGDGLLVSSAQGDVSPVPFPTITSTYGAWTKIGGRQYAATFVGIFYDVPTGNYEGMLKVNNSITLSDSGDEWSATFKGTVLDPDGNVVATLNGTAQAKRIKVEPVD